MWLAVSIINLLFIFTISFPKQLVHGLLQPESDKFLKQQWLKLWHPFVSCKYHLLYSPVFGINASGKKYVRALQVVIKTSPPETLHWSGLSWILSQLEKFKLLSISELNGEEIRVGFRLFLGYSYLGMSERQSKATGNTAWLGSLWHCILHYLVGTFWLKLSPNLAITDERVISPLSWHIRHPSFVPNSGLLSNHT